MSAFSDRVRKFDNFGARFSLSYQGEDTFSTFGGGTATICLKVMILTYLCIRTIALVDYRDPEISSYVIMEDRSDMTESYNL